MTERNGCRTAEVTKWPSTSTRPAGDGTETDVANIKTIDVKKIFDLSVRLVAIVYPNTRAGSSEDLASCQLVTQSRKGEKLLALVHRYILMDQLISLGVAGQEDLFARFAYNGDGSLASEEHRRKETSTFTRRFVYNSVEFLRKLPLFWNRKSTIRTAATASRPLETDKFRASPSKLIEGPTTGDPATSTTLSWPKLATCCPAAKMTDKRRSKSADRFSGLKICKKIWTNCRRASPFT